jgi:hypothetical protein
MDICTVLDPLGAQALHQPGHLSERGGEAVLGESPPRLTEEHMSLHYSVNRGIFGHVAGAWGRGGGGPPLYSSVTGNRGIYSTIFIGYT